MNSPSRPSAAKPDRLAEPKVARLKPYLLAGLQKKFSRDTVGDIPALWGQLAPHFGQLPTQIDPSAYGVGIDMFNDCGSFEYLAGIEVATFSGLPAGWSGLTIPAQTYAIFPHQGHVTTLKDTVDAILHQWLPKSGRRPKAEPPAGVNFIEYYSPQFDPRTGLGGMEVWLVVEG